MGTSFWGKHRRRGLVFCSLAALSLLGACDDTEEQPCDSEDCSGHGTCEDSSGEAVCTCEEGFTGDDCSDEVDPCEDEDCSGHGSCRDSGGEAVCDCDAGYSGDDCSDEVDPCDGEDCSGHGDCDAVGGEPVCDCEAGYGGADCAACAAGYQDNDDDGSCEESCVTADLSCGDHGHCDDQDGTAECVCNDDWTGDDCEGCPEGTQDNDDDGVCLPDCELAGLECGENAHCEDDEGRATCLCDDDNQDNDGDGACAPDCAHAGLDCGDNGACEDLTGEALCRCDAGYTGADCADCAAGYQDNDANGSCLPGCTMTGLTCAGHGHCDDASGMVVCDCDAGYQDHDDDGACTPDCELAELTCPVGQTCDDTNGTAACSCGEGFQDNDADDICLPDCATSALECGAHGECSDASGLAQCDCTEGYDRSDCAVCASPYYQDNDEDGTCTPTCYFTGAAFTCDENEECSDATGALACVCERGYQDNDDDGACLPTCATAMADEAAPLECPEENGSCDDEGGTAVCVCDEGYADDVDSEGDDCLACAAGYQDNDENDECEPDCATAAADGLDCGTLGCDDSSGEAMCNCEAGTQDNDLDGECLPDCSTAGLGCDPLAHQSCDDESGEAQCVCDDGFYPDGAGSCVAIGTGIGDTCATMLELPLADGTYFGDTTAMVPDYTFDCAWYPVPLTDVVYHFSAAAGETRHVRITMMPYDSSYTSYMFSALLLLEGDTCDTATQVDCSFGLDPRTYQFVASVLDVELDGGVDGQDYYLVAGLNDYFEEGVTGFILEVENVCEAGSIYSPDADVCLDNPCLPENPCSGANRNACVVDITGAEPTYECRCNVGFIESDDACVENPSAEGEACEDVAPITVIEGEGSVSGTTTGAEENGEGSCAGDRPTPDRVYGFTLTEETMFTASLECDDEYDSLMHLRTTCDDAESQIVCHDGGANGDTEEFNLVLQPGTYYLFIDGWDSRPDPLMAVGDYTLTYTFHSNPCGVDDESCPGTPVCVGTGDWSSHTCVCEEEGTLPNGEACVDDPCDPDPCEDVPNTVCEADLDAGTHECVCDAIHVDDGAGRCILAPDAEWTILWYWAMDNNLSQQTLPELEMMMDAAMNENVRIVALIDRYNEDGYYAEIVPGEVRRIVELGDPDTSDWHTLRDFGIWATENYPAQHYAFIISDHGGDWRSASARVDLEEPTPRAICWDDNSPSPDTGIEITNGDFAAALEGVTRAAGQRLDLLILDACIMSGWEEAVVSEPYADYLIASPSSQYGYQVWTDWITTLAENVHDITTRELAETFVDLYREGGQFGNEGSMIYATSTAVTDLSTIGDLEVAVTTLADAFMANESDELYSLVDSTRHSSQIYNDRPYLVDFLDFARNMSTADGAPAAVADAAEGLVNQLDETIAYSWANPNMTGLGYLLSGSNGLSTYFPARYYQLSPLYDDVGALWSENTTWDDFLESFGMGTPFFDCGTTDTPDLTYLGTELSSTLDIAMSSGSQQAIIQTFRASGRELHSVRIAVRKTEADEMAHDGFVIGVSRPGGGYLYGPYHRRVAANEGDVQYLCIDNLGVNVEPGEELRIELHGGEAHFSYSGPDFRTPIEWPIEYAASADDLPPYADGEVLVNLGDGEGEVPIGEANGDGIPGTLWFEVY